MPRSDRHRLWQVSGLSMGRRLCQWVGLSFVMFCAAGLLASAGSAAASEDQPYTPEGYLDGAAWAREDFAVPVPIPPAGTNLLADGDLIWRIAAPGETAISSASAATLVTEGSETFLRIQRSDPAATNSDAKGYVVTCSWDPHRLLAQRPSPNPSTYNFTPQNRRIFIRYKVRCHHPDAWPMPAQRPAVADPLMEHLAARCRMGRESAGTVWLSIPGSRQQGNTATMASASRRMPPG